MRDRLAIFFDLWSKGFFILLLLGFFGGIFLAGVAVLATGSTMLVDLANRALYSSAEAARLEVKYLQGAREVLFLVFLTISAPPFVSKFFSAIAEHVLPNLPAGHAAERQGATESVDYPES